MTQMDVQLDVGGLTDNGSRLNNEDCWSGTPRDLAPQLGAAKGLLFVVCDGMGGHQAGEVASKMATETIQQIYYADPNPDVGARLQAAIEEANRRVYHDAVNNSKHKGMGTTVTAAVIHKNEVTVANVGDSRTYWIRDGQIVQISQDHTWVADQEKAGIVTAEEARSHPNRNVVTRTLGGGASVKVDVFPPQHMRPGDVVLLCTDGLSGVVTDPEMAVIVSQSPNSATAARKLVDVTLSRGAPDNVTAVVLALAGPEAMRATRRLEQGKAGRKTARPAVLAAAVGAGVLSLALVAAGILVLTGSGRGTDAMRGAAGSGSTPTASLSAPAPPTTTGGPTDAPGTAPAVAAQPAEAPGAATAMPMETATPAAPPATVDPPLLVKPLDGMVGHFGNGDVRFEWAWPPPKSGQRFRVAALNKDTGEDLAGTENCPARETVCEVKGVPAGEYAWLVLVEQRRDEQAEFWDVVARSQTWGFAVWPPADASPPPAATTAPAGPTSATVLPASPTPTAQARSRVEVAAPVLLSPAEGETAQAGTLTTFSWQWEGTLKENWGFEVLVWKEGEAMGGAHDARETIGMASSNYGIYELAVDPEGASAVTISGEYQWSVWVVQLDPYKPISQPALPAIRLQVSFPGGGGDDGGGGEPPPR